MTAASEIVRKAMFEIGATSPIKPVHLESVALAHDYLIDLLEEWEGQGVETGIRIPEPDDQNTNINEPEDARQAVILVLATRLAGPLQKPIPPDVLNRKNEAETRFFRKYRYQLPPDRELPQMEGEGNFRVYR